MKDADIRTDQIDVKYVARLARLYLSDEEAERLQKQLDEIVKYIGQISELDLSSVEPASHTSPRQNVFRQDESRPGTCRDVVLQNAPKSSKGMFIVPKIVE